LKILRFRLLTTLFAVIAPPAGAALLSDLLLTNDDITVDGVRFDGWEIERNTGSVSVDTSAIVVGALGDDPATAVVDPGLVFNALNEGLTVSNGDFIDFAILFRASATSEKYPIKDVFLGLTDFSLDPLSDSIIEAADFAFDPDFIGLGSATVSSDPFFGPTSDGFEFPLQPYLYQELEIFVDSGFVGAETALTELVVRKSRVPNPATAFLFLAGVSVFLLIRRPVETEDCTKTGVTV
jgi:hypothetical protein